jgi:hypothetical protein
LTTKVLDYLSPYEHLFHLPPYFTYFQAFRCQCFPRLYPYTNDKLSYRSTPCIFIDYSSNHKGFWCLDPSFRHVYISRNVIFDEEKFSAQSILTNPASCVPSSGKTPSLSFTLPSYIFTSPSVFSPPLESSSPDFTPDCVSPDTHSTPDFISPDNYLNSFISSLTFVHPETYVSLSPAPVLSHSSAQQDSAPFNLQDSALSPLVPSTQILTRSQTDHLNPRRFPDFHLYSTRHPLQVTHASLVCF